MIQLILFKVVEKDCRSVTGSNLRRIMYLVGKTNTDHLLPVDSTLMQYCEMPESETWRLSVVNELTDVKFGEAEVSGFSRDELKVILHDVCTL